MHKISVVTICFNNLEDLKKTCEVIDQQELKPYEHIIINGSTTPDIEQFLSTTPQPPYRKWKSEPDKGISDAFNKGIDLAAGDIIHLQNAGDYYFDKTVLKEVSQAFEQNPQAAWVHGMYAQFRGGAWVVSGKPFERAKLYRGMRTIGHPTMFLKKELYYTHGYFDLEKKIAMDYDILVRIADEPFIFLPKPLVYFIPGGVSESGVRKSIDEMQESYFKYHGFSLKAVLWGLRIQALSSFTSTKAGSIIFKLKNRKKQIAPPPGG